MKIAMKRAIIIISEWVRVKRGDKSARCGIADAFSSGISLPFPGAERRGSATGLGRKGSVTAVRRGSAVMTAKCGHDVIEVRLGGEGANGM